MADIFQGEALPAITTTTQEQTTAPEFYTNYLQDIANLGQGAVAAGGVAGLSPLQQQAMALAPTAAFSGMGTLGTGANLATSSGTTAAPEIVGSYMNPYTQYVVDEMARLQGKNIRENLMPALQGAAGSMGGFGSQRQFKATGESLRDMQQNLIGQQYGALSSGYKDAISAAQNDLQRQMNVAQVLGGLGQQQSNVGTTGLKTMADLGAIEQAQAQKQLDYPMAATQTFAKLLQGYQIPTGQTKQTTGSQGYSGSPLAQIAGLLTALASYQGSQAPKTTSTTSTTG